MIDPHPKPRPLPGQRQLPGFSPEIPPTNSRALKAAWRKGRDAALEGRSLVDCPYPDLRGGSRGHVVTWSRAFRKWWRDGFESVALFPVKGPLPAPPDDVR